MQPNNTPDGAKIKCMLRHGESYGTHTEDIKSKTCIGTEEDMKFWKMNGAGNDFIIINNIKEHIPQEKQSAVVKTLCERHLSIGADGMMFVEKPQHGGDFKMIYYNSDGSLGEMCGNGARCICRYGFENGLADQTQHIETTAGEVIGHRITKRQYKVRLNDPTVIKLNCPLTIDGNEYECSYVELGDPGIPHAVVPVKDLKNFPYDKLVSIGRKMRFSEVFPKGANVNFYEITGRDRVYERTYERGVEDFTYACGTGTGSLVMVLTLLGKVSGRNVQVDMRGGTLSIDVELAEDGKVKDLFLTGPTNVVAKGDICDEELVI